MENKNIIQQYLNGLQTHLSEDDKKALSYAYGAMDSQIARLKDQYPECPDSLLQLLMQINGTYGQHYGDQDIFVLIFGAEVDLTEYPYYLRSVEQILEGSDFNKSIRETYGEHFESMPGLVEPGIDPDVDMDRWLCFSYCVNNGGTSMLYLDFNPLPGGTRGQVVRYLHDPDSFKVIAGSFDEYLQMVMDKDYSFLLSGY
ncbi:SMI1/KNR4 family protein [Chitinophaga sp. SYP-B3965]|uniref:SMI1/KNR4 family protein n=1 Tax=Chitinophaga sp. SYP-B3965 TaxID=2663120 RepID=UPI001299E5AF|nr:SMI1/KNR4 family protein [Chitinophaga sp. SYP-B3965]MRG44068.1 SMI1/KNR4 family protein [Chitinophaga sp. SYP-B3965]